MELKNGRVTIDFDAGVMAKAISRADEESLDYLIAMLDKPMQKAIMQKLVKRLSQTDEADTREFIESVYAPKNKANTIRESDAVTNKEPDKKPKKNTEWYKPRRQRPVRPVTLEDLFNELF